MDSIQKVSIDFVTLCASIYNFLISVDDVVLRELMMEAMQTALHNLMLIEISAATKSLYYPIFNPDLMLYISFKALLVIVSIILKTLTTLEISQDDEGQLSQVDIESSIAYILHFGRALFKGEESLLNGEGIEVEVENTTNNTNNNITNNKNTTNTTTKTTNNTTNSNNTTNNTNTNNGVKTTNQTNNQITIEPKTKNTTNTTNTTNTSNTTNTTKTNNPPTNTNTTNTTNNTTNSNNTNNTDNGTGTGEYDPFKDDDHLLKCNPDSYNKNNVPPGYPQPPFVMKYEKGQTEDIYKEFMRQKYEYERWENKLILHIRKLKARIVERKKELGIN